MEAVRLRSLSVDQRAISLPKGKRIVLIASLYLLVMALLVAALASSRIGYSLLAFVSIVIASPWLIALARRQLDPFEPIYGLSIFWAVYYVIGPLWRYASGEPRPYGVSVEDRSWDVALVLVALGLAGFLFGYYSRVGKGIGARWRLFSVPFPRGITWLVAIFYAFTVGFRIFQIQSGWFFFPATTREVPTGGISVLFFLSSLAPIAYAYLAIIMLSDLKHKWPQRALPTVIIAVESIFWFLSGYRSMILPLVSIPLMVLWYREGIFPGKAIAITGMAALTLLLPLSTLYRLATINEQGIPIERGSKIVEVVKRIPEVAQGEPLWSVLVYTESWADASIFRRLEGVGTMAALVERVRPDDFLWGETFVTAFNVFVPSLLWPEKREVYRERQEEFCDFILVSTRPCPSVMTQMGELYWNFGPIGVVVGMLIYGVLYRSFYTACRPSAGLASMGLWLYASFWYVLIFAVEGGFIGEAPRVLRQVIGMVGLAFLLSVVRGAVQRVRLESRS